MAYTAAEQAFIDSFINRTITKFASDTITDIRYDTFNGCTQLKDVQIPNCTYLSTGVFNNCTALEEISLPKVTTLNGSNFANCTSLKHIYAPEVTEIGADQFQNAKLETLCFPKATTVGPRLCASASSPLRLADFHACVTFTANVFYTCPSLTSLILRSTTLCSATATTLFNGNWSGTDGPIKKGTGYIYVPRALVEEYKAATNWSTWATQFRALEDYTVDGTIMGELDETKI